MELLKPVRRSSFSLEIEVEEERQFNENRKRAELQKSEISFYPPDQRLSWWKRTKKNLGKAIESI